MHVVRLIMERLTNLNFILNMNFSTATFLSYPQ